MFKNFTLRRLLKAQRGNVAMAFSLTLPVVVGLMGSGFDYVEASKNKSKLQAIVDSAAIAGAREVSLANTNNGQIAEVARISAVSTSKLSGNKLGLGALKVTVSKDRSAIEVSISVDAKARFSGALFNSVKKINVVATANIIGSGNICIMSLNPSKWGGLVLSKNSRLQGKDCGVFTSSVHRGSLIVRDFGQMTAGFICSSGGVKKRTGAQITPTAITDCPVPSNPLANRPKPNVGACDHTNLVLRGFTGVLSPGVYCGGLKIQGRSAPRFEPGIYIMKDGPLIVRKSSKLIADGVGFYLTGTNASFKFFKKSIVRLRAPTEGLLAGVLIFQDPDIPMVGVDDYEPTRNVIRSSSADVLEGTIYLPRGRLLVDGEGTIAQNSAYTAIIVDRMRLNEGPTLVLNSDYKSTAVPVPEGIAGGQVVLAN